MVWFVCDACGDTIKKPKVSGHLGQCPAHSLTCVDCSTTFDRYSVHSHSSCVTEKEKYVDCVTKPNFQGVGTGTQKQPQGPVGLQFLSDQRPWKCSLCKLQCSDRNALMQHARGVKHSRKCRSHDNAKMAEEQVGAQKGSNPEDQKPIIAETSVKDQCGGSHPKQDCTKKKQKRKLQESRSTDAASATEMTASFGNKSVQEENDKKRAKKQKMKKDKSQQLSSLEPDGSRKTRATSGKLSNSVVNGIPHAISAEKIVRSTLKKVGGSCTTKKMREILRSKLGMKKVKGILAEVQDRMDLKLENKKLILLS